SERLLLIRPVSRWRILLSKLMTVIIFCLVLMTVTFSLTFLSSGIVFGGEMFSVPDLIYGGEAVREISAALNTVKCALLDSTSMILAVILAFFLSLIIKNGIVSMALGIALFAFGELLARVSLYVGGYVGIVRYTLFPYMMNMQNIRYEPLDRLLSREISFADGGIYVSMGLIVIGVHVALLIFLSFAAFNRQQIKS
ncbi:MAG: hypothetical protein NC228_03555, partial [[Eubacterium] siraeum]|nr:hypothetical protein [[Eubacterium] siraeum]